MKKLQVLRKKIKFECYKCSGTGNVKKQKCEVCKGTGKFKETHYIHIIGNQAFDGDTVK